MRLRGDPKVVGKLKAELEAQKIVWLEGRHLPQAVVLSPSARGVELPVVQ